MSEVAEVELDEEAKRLKLEAIKAVARKEIAEAHRATLVSPFPDYDLKPLEGKVEAGASAGLVARLLGYSLLREGASRIVNEIKDELGTEGRVLLVDDRLLTARDWSYHLVHDELNAHVAALDAAAEPFPKPPKASDEERRMTLEVATMAAAVIPTIIGAAAGLLGMFRTNYSITGKDFTIGTTPLLAAVTRKLLEAGVGLSVEHFSLAEGAIITKFDATRTKRLELEHRSRESRKKVQDADRILADLRMRLKETSASLLAAISENKAETIISALRQDLATLEGRIKSAEDSVSGDRANLALADTVCTRFDTFAASVITPGKDGGYPPLVAAAMWERLRDESNGYTHVLYVAVEGAGGETITNQSYLGKTGVVVFMGGAQISYLLLDVKTKATVSAGTQPLLGRMTYDLKRGDPGRVMMVDLTSSPPGSNGRNGSSGDSWGPPWSAPVNLYDRVDRQRSAD
jgi:hypothetical protein